MVEDFLEEAARSGSRDSEGYFTVNLQAQSAKLAEFMLERSEDYLLLLVRAAVAAGATGLRTSVGNEEVVVRIFFRDCDTADHLVGALFQGGSVAGSALLNYALRASFGHAVERVRVLAPNVQVMATHGEARARVMEGHQKEVRVNFRRGPSNFFSNSRRSALEHKTLSGHCAFSPIPIFLDGRQLNPEDAPSRILPEQLKSPYLFISSDLILAEAYLRESASDLGLKPYPASVAVLLEEGERYHYPKWQNRCGSILLREVEEGASVYFRLGIRQSGPGVFLFVKEGVVVSELADSRLPEGMLVVVGADRIQTDLSQFRLRLDEHAPMLRRLVVRAEEVASLLAEELDILKKRTESSSDGVSAASVLAVSLSLVCLFASGPFAGGMAAILGAGYCRAVRTKNNDPASEIRARIRRKLRSKV